jgi:sugar lactone lactonase YvrE
VCADGDTILRMRFLLLLAAFLLGSCRSERDRPQPKLETVSATHAEPEVTVATTVAFTEGPAQGPDGLIYFTDITNNRILRFDPRTKKHEVFRADSNRSNGLLFEGEGRLIACESSDPKRSNPRLTRTDMKTGRVEVLTAGLKESSSTDLMM